MVAVGGTSAAGSPTRSAGACEPWSAHGEQNVGVDIDQDVAEILLAAQPALTAGRRVGVLLSHGFTGSPFSIAPWARALNEHGYGVTVPRLPGHGTDWRELNRTGWDDWYGEIQRAFGDLAAAHDVIVVGGLSMGGALALRLAADQPELVAGVILVNPAVATRRKDVLALPLLKYLIPAFPAIANDIKKPGQDEHAYRRTPLKAAHSMMRGWAQLRAELDRVTAPILYFRSSADHVVDDLSETVICEGTRAGHIEIRRLQHSYHVATLDNDAPEIFAESASFIRRATAAS